MLIKKVYKIECKNPDRLIEDIVRNVEDLKEVESLVNYFLDTGVKELKITVIEHHKEKVKK